MQNLVLRSMRHPATSSSTRLPLGPTAPAGGRTKWLAAGLSGASFLAAALVSTGADAQELRYLNLAPGSVIATGNTLGLSKENNANAPGTRDSIGTFIALDPAAVDAEPAAATPWPAGTTRDWHANGSSATLTLPAGAEVLYAELVWAGSYGYGELLDTNDLDTSVTLRMGGDSTSVTPDPTTSTTVSQAAIGLPIVYQYYQRSADVTSFVQAHGAGVYTTAGVPGTQLETINSLNAAGWTLVVAYRRDGDPIRNLSVFVGNDGKFVDENTTVDYEVSGFCTPPTGTVNGTLAISTVEGDANLTGDELLIGQTTAGAFVNLDGPNNPEGNFFCGQMNGPTGQLDQTGTFGDRNHDAMAGVNVAGGRQGWDVAHVGLSSAAGQLSAGQTSAIIRTSTQGDSYMPILVGLAIDVNAPKFTDDGSGVETSASSVGVGDSFQVTLHLKNEGKAPATDVVFRLALPDGLDLKGFSTDGTPGDVDGNPVDEAGMVAGARMGNVAVDAERVVVLELEVVSELTSDIALEPAWDYDYVSCTNQPALTETYRPNVTTIDFVPTTTASTTSAATTSASTGAGGLGGAGGNDDGGEAVAEGGGFDCAIGAGGASAGSMALAVVAAGLGLARRRRRR